MEEQEHEITCVQHNDGIITHVDVKGGGRQSVNVVARLISEGHYFFTDNNGIQTAVYASLSENGEPFLTTDPDRSDMNTLDRLQECR